MKKMMRIVTVVVFLLALANITYASAGNPSPEPAQTIIERLTGMGYYHDGVCTASLGYGYYAERREGETWHVQKTFREMVNTGYYSAQTLKTLTDLGAAKVYSDYVYCMYNQYVVLTRMSGALNDIEILAETKLALPGVYQEAAETHFENDKKLLGQLVQRLDGIVQFGDQLLRTSGRADDLRPYEGIYWGKTDEEIYNALKRVVPLWDEGYIRETTTVEDNVTASNTPEIVGDKTVVPAENEKPIESPENATPATPIPTLVPTSEPPTIEPTDRAEEHEPEPPTIEPTDRTEEHEPELPTSEPPEPSQEEQNLGFGAVMLDSVNVVLTTSDDEVEVDEYLILSALNDIPAEGELLTAGE